MDARQAPIRIAPRSSAFCSMRTVVKTGARIKVIGVGGGGGNAVNRMVTAGLGDVEFIVANTDQQALQNNAAPIKVQIGAQLTKGLGAGADPNVGRAAALEDTDKILEVLTRRRHGVRHDRPRRRHRHRRRAGHRQPRQPDGRAHRRRRHQAVQVRGPQARRCRPRPACASWPSASTR